MAVKKLHLISLLHLLFQMSQTETETLGYQGVCRRKIYHLNFCLKFHRILQVVVQQSSFWIKIVLIELC